MNKVILVGNVSSMGDLAKTKSGKDVINMSLATNEKYKSEQGEAKQHTDFHSLTLYGKIAEIASKHVPGSRRPHQLRLLRKGRPHVQNFHHRGRKDGVSQREEKERRQCTRETQETRPRRCMPEMWQGQDQGKIRR